MKGNIRMRRVNLMQSKKLTYIITTSYMFLILAFTLKPGSKEGAHNIAAQVFSNFSHIPAYAILAYLILRCFSVINYKAYVESFMISVLYGAFMEFLQMFVPLRTASLMDIGLNTIGILLALLFYHKLYPLRYPLNAN